MKPLWRRLFRVLRAALISLAFISLMLILVLVVAVVDHVRSRTADTGVCPEAGQAFWEASISAHLGKSDDGRPRTFTIVPGARYDEGTNWWIVPFDSEYGAVQALLDCTGRLEISGREH